MSGRFQFENFGPDKRRPDPVPEDLEAKLVASYEHGYKAGWDDATRAQNDSRAQIGADFARSLQEISFTYNEVRGHLMRAVEPLLLDMARQVLPTAAAATLGQSILEALRPMLEADLDVPVELVINPTNRDAVAELLKEGASMPLHIIEEPTLGSGQAFVRLGATEKSIDMDEVLGAVSQAIDAYFHAEEREEIKNVG